jgi:F0F1-type ATP synthase membrane subunit b/b'
MYFLFAIINFLLFVFILVFFTRKPIKKYWVSRHETVKASLESAHNSFVKASSLLKNWEDSIKNIPVEKKSILEQLDQRGKTEGNRLVSLAKEYAEQLRRDLKTNIEFETAVAIGEIKRALATEATDVAAERIGALPAAQKRAIAEKSSKEISNIL